MLDTLYECMAEPKLAICINRPGGNNRVRDKRPESLKFSFMAITGQGTVRVRGWG